MEPKDIPLKFPITVGEGETAKQITSVRLRRLQARDWKYAPKNEDEAVEFQKDMTKMLPLLASVTELPLEVVDKLDLLEDFPEVAKELINFTNPSPSTGTSSSGV